MKNDRITVAAISLMAMCLVTFDHEALGHGGACLLLGGHIRILTSAIFRCDLRSIWIDPAGPFANLLIGALLLLLVEVVPRRAAGMRLFLILAASFSLFWEAGYLIDAMRGRHGDWYFAAQDFLGEPTAWWRMSGVLAGIGLYVFTSRWASGALSSLWPHAAVARNVARTAWTVATLGAVLAALAYSGDGLADVRDAALEIGAGSWPLLLIPSSQGAVDAAPPAVFVQRNWIAIAAATAVYAIFVATLGRGLFF
ncbi:MAG TPA: hypothetical protein VKG63_06455 [Steroidobacteraceae bacterium]|nr:hypothetical protein [Steroidobacteraceae bacterium]